MRQRSLDRRPARCEIALNLRRAHDRAEAEGKRRRLRQHATDCIAVRADVFPRDRDARVLKVTDDGHDPVLPEQEARLRARHADASINRRRADSFAQAVRVQIH
jgi:hypothetical protein